MFTFLSFICGKTYDATSDGNTYHKLAVGTMKNGWNPVYEDVINFNKKQGNPFDILKDNVNVKWVDHYAKGTEIFGAVIYAFCGNIETGKVYNLLWLYVGVFVLYGILRKMKLNTWKSLLVSFVLAFNPILLVQLTNYYLDGVLAVSLFIIIICCIYNIKYAEGESREDVIERYFILAMAIIWCCNAKFTGLAFAAIFCFVLYLYRHIKNYIEDTKDKKKFKNILVKDTIFYTVVVVIAVVIVGSSSYFRNLLDHGHPMYPLYGKGHVVNMVMLEIPSSLQKEDPFTIFFTSLFAKGENSSASYDKSNNQPNLKIPFTLSRQELRNYGIPDIRMGGFGPLFSGIFIISCFGILAMILEYIKKKDWNNLSLLIVVSVTIAALLFLLDGSYWARYIPYFYLMPIFILIHYFQKDFTKFKSVNIFALVIFTLLSVNSFLIFYTQFNRILSDRHYVVHVLNDFMDYAKDKKEIEIKIPHSGLQGIQYNLDDLGINNYKLSQNKELKRQGHFFQY